MVAYDTLVGEFRVHYAGFFDPGFGDEGTGGEGSRAVLEVRSHDVPFLISDSQILGRLVYERLTQIPDRIYGRDIGSTYQQQGLKLGKQFMPWIQSTQPPSS
jgi:dCTP deaminase